MAEQLAKDPVLEYDVDDGEVDGEYGHQYVGQGQIGDQIVGGVAGGDALHQHRIAHESVADQRDDDDETVEEDDQQASRCEIIQWQPGRRL